MSTPRCASPWERAFVPVAAVLADRLPFLVPSTAENQKMEQFRFSEQQREALRGFDYSMMLYQPPRHGKPRRGFWQMVQIVNAVHDDGKHEITTSEAIAIARRLGLESAMSASGTLVPNVAGDLLGASGLCLPFSMRQGKKVYAIPDGGITAELLAGKTAADAAAIAAMQSHVLTDAQHDRGHGNADGQRRRTDRQAA